MKKKPNVKRLKKLCLDLVNQIVSIRDNDTCQKCGARVYGSNRHRSHVIPKSAGNKLAFDPMNIKILCFHCHMDFWHLHPTESGEWFKTKFPERWAYLEANRGIKQMKIMDWIELWEKLTNELEVLK